MKTGNCCAVCKVVTVLVSLGAINWGLAAFFQMDLVARIFGGMSTASKIVYGIIAVAGVMKLLSEFTTICPCSKKDTGECKK